MSGSCKVSVLVVAGAVTMSSVAPDNVQRHRQSGHYTDGLAPELAADEA